MKTASELLELYAGQKDHKTREELIAQQAAQEAEAAASDAKNAAADKAASDEATRKEAVIKSQASADSFVLGGDAMENLTGQGNVLDAAPDNATPAAADDFDAMFDEVMAEEMAKDEAKVAPNPKTEKAASTRQPRAATQAADRAGANASSALANAIDGLGALFGGGGKLSSGFTFDEDTYAKAKPLFKAAVTNLGAARSDLKEAMRAVIRMVMDKFGA